MITVIIRREELRLGKYSWAPEEVEAAHALGLLSEDEYELALDYAKRVPFELSPYQWAEEKGIRPSHLGWTLGNQHYKIVQMYKKAFKSSSDGEGVNLGDILAMGPEELEKLATKSKRRRRKSRVKELVSVRKRYLLYDPFDEDIIKAVEEATGRVLVLYRRRQLINQVSENE